MTLALMMMLACSPGKTSGGEDYFSDFDCSSEPWDWYSDAVGAVMESDEDGDFDFDPESELVTGREGNYDFEDGDLSWEDSYLPNFYLVAGGIDGYGTVFDNGDVDLLYRAWSEDILGEESHTRVRIERDGCDSTTQSWEIDADDDLAATPSEDPFVWETEIVSDDRVESTTEVDVGSTTAVYDRVSTSDSVTVTTFEYADGSAMGETTSYGDGTAVATQSVTGDKTDAEYEIDYRVDGSRRIRSNGFYAGTNDPYSECDYEIAYDGDGGGDCTFYLDSGTLDCEITFSDDSCELDCGSDGTFDC